MSDSIVKKTVFDLKLPLGEKLEIRPDQICPDDIFLYPAAIELCDRFVLDCRRRRDQLMETLQVEEDLEMKRINREIPENNHKPRFKSEALRQMELRLRLQSNKEYLSDKEICRETEVELGAWRAKSDELRRELRLLETEFVTTGRRSFPRPENN